MQVWILETGMHLFSMCHYRSMEAVHCPGLSFTIPQYCIHACHKWAFSQLRCHIMVLLAQLTVCHNSLQSPAINLNSGLTTIVSRWRKDRTSTGSIDCLVINAESCGHDRDAMRHFDDCPPLCRLLTDIASCLVDGPAIVTLRLLGEIWYPSKS